MVVSPGGLCQGLATLNVGRQAVQRSQESSSWTTTVFAVVLMPWMSACRFWKLGYRIFYSCGKQNTLCFARSLKNGKICCNIMRVHVVGVQLESMICVFKTVLPSKQGPTRMKCNKPNPPQAEVINGNGTGPSDEVKLFLTFGMAANKLK